MSPNLVKNVVESTAVEVLLGAEGVYLSVHLHDSGSGNPQVFGATKVLSYVG